MGPSMAPRSIASAAWSAAGRRPCAASPAGSARMSRPQPYQALAMFHEADLRGRGFFGPSTLTDDEAGSFPRSSRSCYG